MPNKISLRVKDEKQLVKASKEALRKATPLIARKRMLVAARDLQKRMKKPGKDIKYPVHWDSDKQKIKVIIMLKRRKNLPYKRGHKMEKGWKVVSLKTGYSVENRVRGNIYVYGNKEGVGQSAIHTGRWPYLFKEANTVIKALPAAVRNSLVRFVAKMAQESKSGNISSSEAPGI